MEKTMKPVVGFRFRSEKDISDILAQLRSATSSKFRWRLRESEYEGDYVLGSIESEVRVQKVRILKDQGYMEVEIYFNSSEEGSSSANEATSRERIVADLKAHLAILL